MSLNREDVAVAHHQIDVIEGNAFRLEAVIDNLLMEAGIVLAPGDALLSDRKCNVPVAQKAGTDIVVVGVNAKNVSVALGHEGLIWIKPRNCATASLSGPLLSA